MFYIIWFMLSAFAMYLVNYFMFYKKCFNLTRIQYVGVLVACLPPVLNFCIIYILLDVYSDSFTNMKRWLYTPLRKDD